MADQKAPSQSLRDEADEAFAGPGVVATKSQTKGSVAGTLIGTVIGLVVGVLMALLFFREGTNFIIALIAFAVAGATAGGTAGGFLRNRPRMERGDPDV